MKRKKSDSNVSENELRDFLEVKSELYNSISFIETDPIQIPHRFSKLQDIEISGFLASTIAWGNRKSIIRNAGMLMEWMDHAPHDFILNAGKKEKNFFLKFTHRTFNGEDCRFFISALQHIYRNHESMEDVFLGKESSDENSDLKEFIVRFRNEFFSITHPLRSQKHVSNPEKGSASKRLCMFLRWMVRPTTKGVDLGIWKSIPTSELYLPLDVHTSRNARILGLLTRNQDDWKALEELMETLRKMDSNDPVKYDFALFGIGVNEKGILEK